MSWFFQYSDNEGTVAVKLQIEGCELFLLFIYIIMIGIKDSSEKAVQISEWNP